MKQLILATCFFFLALSVYAQDVSNTQRPIITKKTATWCSNCGSWGWDLFEGLLEDNQSKALLVTAHYSGDLQSNVSKELTDNFSGSGQPIFYFGNIDQNATRNNSGQKRTDIRSAVDAAASQTADVGAALTATIDGDQLSIQTKTKFFDATSGNYYVSIFLMEDDVINNQTSRGSNVAHSFVLRAAAENMTFGKQVAEGSISADSEYETSFTLDLNPAWNKDNLSLAAIVWKLENSTYQYVNASPSVTEFQVLSSTQNLYEAVVNEVSIAPNPASSNFQLTFRLPNAEQQMQLELIDILGRSLEVRALGDRVAGQHQIDISTQNLEKGNYWIRISGQSGQLSRSFSVR